MNGLLPGYKTCYPKKCVLRILFVYGVSLRVEVYVYDFANEGGFMNLDSYFAMSDPFTFHPFVCLCKS